MKTLILASALPLFVSLATAQDKPAPAPAKDEPAETVRKAAPAAWLGVSMSEEDGQVTIGQVLPESPAAKAGLKEGDVVLSIGDSAVKGHADRVISSVGERKPGETLELRILRGDKEETLTVQLGERPPPKEEFRGEFRKMEKKTAPDKFLKDGVKDKIKEAEEKIEKETDRIKDQLEKLSKPHRLMKEKLDEFKGQPDKRFEEKRFDYKLNPDRPELRLHEMPDKLQKGLWLYMDQDNKGTFVFPHDKNAENAIWKRVEDSVGRALKESGLAPDVIEKAMNAVKDARKNGPEQEARRAKLKAEAARIEKEMQALKERADKLRDELNKSGE